MHSYSKIVQKEQIVMLISDSPKTDYHEHDFLELTYVLQGKAEHTLDQNTTTISEGNYFIVDYGIKHKYSQIGETPLKVINCLFLPRLIDETLRNCQNFRELADNYLIKFSYKDLKDRPTKFIYYDDDAHIRNLISKLENEYLSKDLGYLGMMRSILIEILIDTMRKVKDPSSAASESDMVQQICAIIKENYMEKLSLTEISHQYAYSLGYISRKFKEETGSTFQEYLQSVRIWESCRLLLNSNKKITEIASLVGYSDIKFFNRLFKKQTGLSPRKFRQNQKNSDL